MEPNQIPKVTREKVVRLDAPPPRPVPASPAAPVVDVALLVNEIQTAAAAAVRGSAIGAFQAVAAMLAVRLLLILALFGAFALAWAALQLGTQQAVVVLVAYAVLVMIPLVYLEVRSKLK